MPDFDDLKRLLAEDAREGIFATGVQVCVELDGEVVLDEAFGVDGLSRPMTTDRIHRVHCAGKPLTALAIAALVDDGEVSFHDRVGNIVDEPIPAPLFDLTIDEILSHRAGLFALFGRDVDLVRPEIRKDLILNMAPSRSQRAVAAYSEVAGWGLLSMAVEALTSATTAAFVSQRILAPLNLADEIMIGLSRDAAHDFTDRVAPCVDLNGPRPIPLLGEIAADLIATREPANMTLATMRGLARLYSHLNAVLGGLTSGPVSTESLAHLVEPSGDRAWEPMMQRECRYGYGFMVDLSQHDYGRWCSPASFGHSGYLGMTSAFADPVNDASVALFYNGAIDPESGILFRRVARVESIMKTLSQIAS
jgi:CubicO group peptidase (beta-lactamase class C family)